MTDTTADQKLNFAHHYGENHPHQQSKGWGLAIGAVGVVFGDLGTSPIYTLRECFSQSQLAVDTNTVYGFLSLIFWSLSFIIGFKYVYFLMKANNRGEGGIMALGALALGATAKRPYLKGFIFVAATLGVALFYGDGMITPAISVLSAVEGLQIFSHYFSDFVLPISLVLLIGLFALQKHGTRLLGNIAGPVMVLWFVVLAGLGIYHIIEQPHVLHALNPYYAGLFFVEHGSVALLAMGAVVLCVTGAEAVYSDMGHFGPKPIQRAWFWLVFPALVLNYFGQGALLLSDAEALQSPFYHMVGEDYIIPLMILTTLATIIASQAVITGAFSLSNQAIQVGLLPRLTVRHTDAHQRGQIYIPEINWLLLAGVVMLVLNFRTSEALASMYGVAVTGTMLATSCVTFLVIKYIWRRSWFFSLALGGVLVAIDAFLLSSTLLKVHHGGWVTLVIGAIVYITMITWKRGREHLVYKRRADSLSVEEFIDKIEKDMPHRVPGTAVYMAYQADYIPYPLLYSLKHNKILHECVVLLTVRYEERPYVPEAERLVIGAEKYGIWHVIVRYGFMERPRVLRDLRLTDKAGLHLDLHDASYFVGRDRIVMGRHPFMARWRTRLFIWLAHNAVSATDFYQLPRTRVVETGAQVEI